VTQDERKKTRTFFGLCFKKFKEETKVLGLLNEKSKMTEALIQMVQSTFGLVDNSLSDNFTLIKE
jgi:hypothetical protein